MAKNSNSEPLRHRPGVFKQQNKIHKTGRHRSKGSIETLNKGKIQRISVKKVRGKFGKEDRRNQSAQIRKNKRQEFLKHVRKQHDPPCLIALVSLSPKISYFDVLNKLKSSDSEAEISFSENNYTIIRVPRFKQRFMFVAADTSRIYHTLNATKFADVIIFLASVGDMDENMEHFLTCITTQGISSSVVAIIDIQTLPKKKHAEAKENVQKAVSRLLPDVKIINLDSYNDFMLLFRIISTSKMEIVAQRDKRPYLLAEGIHFEKESSSLAVSGYLRGKTLSANDLVHVTGWKDFKLSRIAILQDPHRSSRSTLPDEVISVERPSVLEQESLQSENIPDSMDAEQTWPTEEELKEADERTQKRKVKIVPEGTSEYQATWIPDCDADELSDMSDEVDEENAEEDMDEEMSICSSVSGEEIETKSRVSFVAESMVSEYNIEPDKYDKRIDAEEEMKTRQKLKDARMDKQFPDEVDTPMDIPARVRFQKYRGLKSARTTVWDPKENLPVDYARIFTFQNFKRTHAKVQKATNEKDGIWPGAYVRLYLDGVTQFEYDNLDRATPFLVVGMLPHEQKMSVVNMVLKRPNTLDSELPIKSKDELIIQCGYRRFKCHPVFSQLGKATVHKYERYFQPDSTVVATVYAPIQFPPASVLAFKEHEDSSVELVAIGSLLSVDPDRVIVKRTVLSGYPFKLHKKSAVLRFMFYNREDVEWFKPIELRTKYGKRGHIKEPLGTHGHMKCIFEKPITSQDTVLLNLYKRIFPKWTYSNLYSALHIDSV